MRKVYFDHAATTPVHPAVAEEMMKYLTEDFGNPSSIHAFGRVVRKGVEHARQQVVAAIGASSVGEIAFTSGGTEAANMAIRGVAYANRHKGNHIITTAGEHNAVLGPCKQLEKEGFAVTVLPLDQYGLITPQQVAEAITDKTILISVMHANNEIGTIYPIREISEIAKERKIIFHTDATQTVGHIPVNVDELGVNLLTFSAHKIYGPKGAGAMYIRKGTFWQPITYGGGQERRRRPGTENVPGIVGLGKAVELACENMKSEAERLSGYRDRIISEVLDNIPNTILTGHPVNRLPGHVSFCFRFIEGESMLLMLDMKGIAISSGSACTSGSLEPSHVLTAIGLTKEVAHGSLRLTMGKDNTQEDVEYFLEALPPIIARLREMSPLGEGCNPCACSTCTIHDEEHDHGHGEFEEDEI
ncbi:cysteine desulfurase NifS [Desulforamulus ruminis]|uniref:Cysteine desulfurase IscS n=1 Tax=Desulforamulus ruminis (strain ATCC 23193 / DSM 2154 / NCIMB 8452 / DL) TaxID=696281 RepID=F6DUY5_DESRL|nr:cysteine desulfurase NifS [Desulforamulus ruminis]AEG61382.1 cysteine desulfurase NifS [Desulforamulus ruminis DSM 2154]